MLQRLNSIYKLIGFNQTYFHLQLIINTNSSKNIYDINLKESNTALMH